MSDAHFWSSVFKHQDESYQAELRYEAIVEQVRETALLDPSWLVRDYLTQGDLVDDDATEDWLDGNISVLNNEVVNHLNGTEQSERVEQALLAAIDYRADLL